MVRFQRALLRLFCYALLVIGLACGQSARPPLGPAFATDPLSAEADAALDHPAWGTDEPDNTPKAAAAFDVADATTDRFWQLPSGQNCVTTVLYRICRVTAYCDRGITSAGTRSGVGQCAAPAYVPLGSLVYIPALGRSFVVTDRTHERFRRSTVDIFVSSAAQCRQFGRRYLECEISVPAKRSHWPYQVASTTPRGSWH